MKLLNMSFVHIKDINELIFRKKLTCQHCVDACNNLIQQNNTDNYNSLKFIKIC